MNEKNLNFIGQNIRMWRRARKLTQEELALKADLAQSSITQLENGKRGFTRDSLKRITDALGMPIAAAFEEKASIKVVRSYDKKAGQKGPVTQYVVLKPGSYEKNLEKKKIVKKEILELMNLLPEDITEHYLRLMKMEAKLLKRKK
tara:strand:- start:1214 stop:1651 length:438 start_codon:yes stop_codon:yes gene_type:complete